MTTSPIASASDSAADPDAGWEMARADLVAAGLATSSAGFLAGLMADGMLDAVGRPEKLPRFLFPGVDPAVVDEIFNLGAAAGFRAGRVHANPGFRRDELEAHRAGLAEVGFRAMAGRVARSAATASRAAGLHAAPGVAASRSVRPDEMDI